jgi:hypothetical protein
MKVTVNDYEAEEYPGTVPVTTRLYVPTAFESVLYIYTKFPEFKLKIAVSSVEPSLIPSV